MGTFEVSTVIHAPISDVWARVAGNIGTIAEWNPGVEESFLLKDSNITGLGSKRRCNLLSNKHLEEEVVTFDEDDHAITFRIVETNLPFDRADIRFQLRSRPSTNGGNPVTHVMCSPDYKLKYGCIGECLDTLVVKRTYKDGMKGLLAGLKKDVEGS
jgi:Polyketide cyclase / dehydrase and lipid transport